MSSQRRRRSERFGRSSTCCKSSCQHFETVPILILCSLIPLMGSAYFLQFLDKYILGQAAIFGLREELVRTLSHQNGT